MIILQPYSLLSFAFVFSVLGAWILLRGVALWFREKRIPKEIDSPEDVGPQRFPCLHLVVSIILLAPSLFVLYLWHGHYEVERFVAYVEDERENEWRFKREHCGWSWLEKVCPDSLIPSLRRHPWRSRVVYMNIELSHGQRLSSKELSYLSDQTEVRDLYLKGFSANPNLEFIKEMDSLEVLCLASSEINSEVGLSSNENLRVVMIRDCEVEDLSFLDGLDRLCYLELSGIPSLDLSTLPDVGRSYEHAPEVLLDSKWPVGLVLQRSGVKDLSPLTEISFPPMQYGCLSIIDEDISDLSPLQEMKGVLSLGCGQTQVTDLDPISSLEHLGVFSCRNTNVSEVSPLRELVDIVTLDLSGTKVSDLSALSKMTKMIQLDISGTPVIDLSALVYMCQIEALDLSNTNVCDIVALSSMGKLEVLDLSNTNVVDISVLASLKSLRKLDLSGTEVKNLAPLYELPKLREVYLGDISASQEEMEELQKVRDDVTIHATKMRKSRVTPRAAD